MSNQSITPLLSICSGSLVHKHGVNLIAISCNKFGPFASLKSIKTPQSKCLKHSDQEQNVCMTRMYTLGFVYVLTYSFKQECSSCHQRLSCKMIECNILWVRRWINYIDSQAYMYIFYQKINRLTV